MRHATQLTHRSGLSMLEMGITVVIVGILAGAILLGKNLIRNAELHNIIVDTDNYKTAAAQFRDQYRALPGDLGNATRYWGWQTGPGCSNNTGAPADANSGVCDGLQDDIVDAPNAAGEAQEVFQIWRHLARAGFIEGKYTGFAGPGGYIDAIIGTNGPATKIKNVGWGMSNPSPAGAWGRGWWGVPVGGVPDYRSPHVLINNNLTIGVKNGAAMPAGNFLTPTEMRAVDTKVDDGKPLRGKIIVRFIYGATAADPACTTAPFSTNSPSGTIGIGNMAYDALYSNDTSLSCSFRVLLK